VNDQDVTTQLAALRRERDDALRLAERAQRRITDLIRIEWFGQPRSREAIREFLIDHPDLVEELVR